MLTSRISTLVSTVALLFLTGCAATGQYHSEQGQVATFQVQIKEIGSDKSTHVLHSPRITTMVGSTGQWRNLENNLSAEGKIESRDGYIVAIQPTIDDMSPNSIGITFVVDQFNSDARDGDRSLTMFTSDVGGEPTIYWQAGGKQYVATAHLLSLE